MTIAQNTRRTEATEFYLTGASMQINIETCIVKIHGTTLLTNKMQRYWQKLSVYTSLRP